MSLTICLATRKRPGHLVRTVERTLENAALKDTHIVIAADTDDLGTMSVKPRLKDPRITWSIDKRPATIGEKYNRAANVRRGEVYLVMVDYAPHGIKGFDERLLEAASVYPDGYAVILNDLANLSFSQINAVTHKLFEAFGNKVYPEHYPYWFVDHHLEEMAKRLGRQVFCNVAVDCSQRPGTLEKREPYFWGILFGWLAQERADCAKAIISRGDFEETAARKRALVGNFKLWDQWSALINEGLRNENAVLGPDTENPDYMRLRNRAEKLILARMKAAGIAPQKAA